MSFLRNRNLPSEPPQSRDALLHAIHEGSPDGILVIDPNGMIAYCNRRLLELFDIPVDSGRDLTGLPVHALLGKMLDMISDQDSTLLQEREEYADPLLEDHCDMELNDGRTLEHHSRGLRSASGEYLGRGWFFRDITERKQVEHYLEEMSQRDPLTGIANRRHFFDRGHEEFTRARRFSRDLSVIMLDIDWFKRINDHWGHAAGDKVIKNVCECAQSALRQLDIFARIGGEEFAILVTDTNIEGAQLVAERIRKSCVAQRLSDGDDMISYTLSLGVATLAPDDIWIDDSLKRADRALYEAKRAGRNRTVLSKA